MGPGATLNYAGLSSWLYNAPNAAAAETLLIRDLPAYSTALGIRVHRYLVPDIVSSPFCR